MLSKQEIFDTAVNGLRKQGCPSMLFDGKENFCAYRGDNGRKCAAGFLIPDHLYSKGMEQASFTVLWNEDRCLRDLVQKNDLPLVQELQDIHDGGHSSGWESSWEELAKRFGLTYHAP